MRRSFLLWSGVAAILLATEANAASLVVESGTLKGATGVDVDGTLYDLAFVEGTCAEVFDGCESAAEFAFQTGLAALNAEAAIANLLVSTIFDQQPFLTFGCEGGTNACNILVPYARRTGIVDIAIYSNTTGPGGVANVFPLEDDHDTAGAPEVWAVFTPSAVPEPETWFLMLSGFLTVGWSLRRRVRLAFKYS